VPQPVVTATSLYHAADLALAARDLARADNLLAALVAQFPDSALLDQALYERARIAYQRHAWADAQRQLDRLAALPATPLAEPGAYLACRIAFEAGDGSAEPCLAHYLARYPRSPHELDVRGLLTELAFRAGGCAAARSPASELIQRYPDAALARGWRQRCLEPR
jgi:outer membrane protein assembly factor BamD (BamD/ComL family)